MRFIRSSASGIILLILNCFPCFGQATSVTFGEVARLGGTPSDVVLDESRQRLYLVNSNASRVDVYDYSAKQVVSSFSTGDTPLAAAISMDNRWLYVTNNGTSSLTVIDLASGQTTSIIGLAAKPEGVEVGADGRVLVTTEGTSSTDQISSLLLVDPSQSSGLQVTPISFAPPPPTPSPLTAITIGRPTTTFRGKLIRTPDGRFIVGLSTVNSNAQTIVFVYEVFSGTVLRSRTVTGQSTVLSISPDGASFTAGYTLYDTASLNVLAQFTSANVPFPLSTTATVNFNSTQNMGGAAFSPDGLTLYSAFNVAPVTTPASRPQASTLLISSPQHLGVRLGIKIPESIVAKMVITSDGSNAWGLSESGLIYLPLSTLYSYPILMPETTTVFLAVDDCSRGLAKAMVKINNIGDGKLTFSVPDTTAALVAQATSGVAPASIQFTLEPGRTNVTRQFGTNLYSGAVTNNGAPVNVNLASPEAINIPNTIQVFMNVRQQDQRGVVFPIPTGLTTTEGLQDIIVDEARNKVYITNSGRNRIEVFDKLKQRFVDPIEVGQLPHQMALAGDKRRLYVANTGGEAVVIVDLDTGKISDAVRFPPRPRSGTTNPISPQAVSIGLFGPQITMSDGSQWKVVGSDATTRPANNVTPTQFTTTGTNGQVRMMSTPGGESIITLAGNGTAYRYDGLADAYTTSSRPYTQAAITGMFYGPLAAGPEGSYYAANGFIFGPSLSVIGGSESPTATQTYALASKRQVAAVAAVDDAQFLRFTTPVKAQITSTTTSDARPTLELVNLRASSVTVVGAVAENPILTLFGNTRMNVPPRQMAVDQAGTAYILTLSGMTVVPLTPTGPSRPQLVAGSGAFQNASDGTRTLKPGAFIYLNGTNLGADASAGDFTPPNVLGGSCVTFSNMQLPLLSTSSSQILAQVPGDLPPGNYVAVVRSLATGQRSDSVVVTVQQ